MANYNNNKFSWKDSSSSFKNNNAFPQQNTFNTTPFQQQPVSSTPLFNTTQQPTQQPTEFQSVFNNQQQSQQQPQQQTSLFNPQQQTNFFQQQPQQQQQQQQPVVVPQNSGSRSAQIESKIDILTVMVQELKNNKTCVSSSSAIHSGIHCDMCKKQNIVGLRYKCVVCPDYDLCEECWNTKRKEHTLHVQKLWCIVEDPVNNLTITGTCG